METLLILLFCLAIGYVCIWVLVNEKRGNVNGEWGFIAMRTPSPTSEAEAEQSKVASARRDWRP